MCGLNAIVTHPENSKNTSKWRVSDVGTAQARREDTGGNYRNVRIYAAPFAKPFVTSGYIHVNWSKTKLQSFSPWIPTPPSTLIGTQPVTTTDNCTYLGSTIASSNSSFNDVNRRIAIATSTMATLSSIWTSSRLSLALKMRLYNSLIISIIAYSSASWTLTKAQKKRLDAFNTKSLRRIVGVRWYDDVTNASILSRTGQQPLTTTIRKLRLGAFGHICRLQPGTQAIDILASTPPSSWRRPRGRPPLRWADQIVNDTQLSLSDAVTATQDRPTWRSIVRDATCPATQAN